MENRVKKNSPPKRQQLVGKPFGCTNPAREKRADFSRGSRTSVLTFPALYSGDYGTIREHHPAAQVVMLPHFLQNKCHDPALLALSFNTFVWHSRNGKHVTIPHTFYSLGPQGMESPGSYTHPKGPAQLQHTGRGRVQLKTDPKQKLVLRS